MPLFLLCMSSVQNLPLPLLSQVNGMMSTVMLSPEPLILLLAHWTGHSGLYWLLSRHHPRQLDHSSTCRNGRQSSVAHRSRSRVFSLLPCRRLHVTAVQRASLEADKEVDFGRLNASDLQVSLRLGLSRKSPDTCDDILVYLNSRLSVKLPVKVSSLETKHDSYASFHITCECNNPSVFMDPFLWPEDIFVRWWRSPRSPVLSLGDSPSVTPSPVNSRRSSISEATCLV